MNVFIRGVFNGSKRASVQVAILHALGKFKILRISTLLNSVSDPDLVVFWNRIRIQGL